MSEQAGSVVSTILLVLGSILMLVAGFGFTSSKNVILAGVACFIASVLIARILKKTRATL